MNPQLRDIHACTRRSLLASCALGFGATALRALLADVAYADDGGPSPRRALDHPAKAKSVIFLYMDGGVSQVDSFDPKPLLEKEHGKPFRMKIEPTQFNNNGNVLASPWSFKPYGQSGIPVSELFQHIGECIDDIAVVRSMTANFSEHTNANYFLHSGSGLQGRPSMGAWTTYGLGSACRDLPGFVVLNGGLIPPGGIDCFNSGFLPASFQGSLFRPGAEAVDNIRPHEARPELQSRKLALMRSLDGMLIDRAGHQDALESMIANYEMAYAMQSSVPNLMDISGESEATKHLYGLDAAYPHTRTYGMQCLVARRLVERGVRFIELTCPNVGVGADRWDQHGNLRQGHADNARAVDQPIAALLKDLKARGLLKDTLVIWTGEFGRTPFAQGSDGRDHNPFGFTVWLAGGGIKGGTVYGETDEYGYKAIDKKCDIHDLHATMLYLLGVDHKRLTFRYGGRDMRLTDVHGEILDGILS